MPAVTRGYIFPSLGWLFCLFVLRLCLGLRFRVRLVGGGDVRHVVVVLAFGMNEHVLVALGATSSHKVPTNRRMPKIAFVTSCAFSFLVQ